MKKEYDFSKGEQGKFFKKNAHIKLPVYLEDQVYDFINEVAQKKKIDLSSVVNELLKKELNIINYTK